MIPIPLTDGASAPLQPDFPEPPVYSVVLTSGPRGTAWQRHVLDGLWHRSGIAGGLPWSSVLERPHVILIHQPDPEEERA